MHLYFSYLCLGACCGWFLLCTLQPTYEGARIKKTDLFRLLKHILSQNRNAIYISADHFLWRFHSTPQIYRYFFLSLSFELERVNPTKQCKNFNITIVHNSIFDVEWKMFGNVSVSSSLLNLCMRMCILMHYILWCGVHVVLMGGHTLKSGCSHTFSWPTMAKGYIMI